jgi:ribose 1,5-bisphosphokinase PhnN
VRQIQDALAIAKTEVLDSWRVAKGAEKKERIQQALERNEKIVISKLTGDNQ